MISTPPAWPTTSPVLPDSASWPDDRRRRVADQRHLRERRPDVGHPARERAALDDDDVALLDPVVGALVEHDHPARLERLAADDPRRDRLVLEARPGAGASAVSCSFSARAASSRAFSFASRSFSSRSVALSVRSWSISPTAPATPDTRSATSAIAPWNGRSANDKPRWNSRMYGFAENAISSSVIAIRIANVIPRRRAWRLGLHERGSMAGDPAPAAPASAERAAVRVGDEDPLHRRVRQLLEDDAGAAGDAGQRVVGDVDGHLGRLGDAAVEAGEQRAAAGEDDRPGP